MIEINFNQLYENKFFLRIVNINFVEETNTYYFDIDPTFQDYDINKRVKVLLCLLEGWVENLIKIEKSLIIYLPFDFQDEYLGCLQLKKCDRQNIEIIYGYSSETKGYNIFPSSKETLIIQDFQPMTEPVSMQYNLVYNNFLQIKDNLESLLIK